MTPHVHSTCLWHYRDNEWRVWRLLCDKKMLKLFACINCTQTTKKKISAHICILLVWEYANKMPVFSSPPWTWYRTSKPQLLASQHTTGLQMSSKYAGVGAHIRRFLTFVNACFCSWSKVQLLCVTDCSMVPVRPLCWAQNGRGNLPYWRITLTPSCLLDPSLPEWPWPLTCLAVCCLW